MKKSKARIYQALAQFSILFDYPPSKERIHAYVEILGKYDLSNFNETLEKLARECERFPSLARILSHVSPEPNDKDTANEMAGEIMVIVGRNGSYQAKEAREELGEMAWLAVERFGGWSTLCMLTYDQMGMARAQLRDLCLSAMMTAKRKPSDQKELEPYQRLGMSRLSDSFKKVEEDMKKLESK